MIVYIKKEIEAIKKMIYFHPLTRIILGPRADLIPGHLIIIKNFP